MVRFYFLVWLCFLFVITFGCSNDSHKNTEFSIHKTYSRSVLEEDFGQALRVLKKNHPALYDFTNQSELDKIVSEQRNKIKDSLTVTEFYDLLAPIVHNIGCGHTVLNFPDWIWADSTLYLPNDFFFFKNSVWLTPNREVLSINNVPVNDLFVHLKNYASTDGNNSSATTHHMRRNFNLYVAAYFGFPADYKIDVKHEDSVHQILLPAVSITTYDESRKDTSPLLSFDFDTTQSIATITIKSFGFYNDLEMFKSFIDDSFKKIEQSKCKNLILDLRGNSGGDPICASHLFRHLINKPTEYFSNPYERYEALASRLEPATANFKGKLYTLIDGACFSTTGHICALLRFHGIGEFIGTETGGTYTCNDGSQTYRLINTGILLRVPGKTFDVAVDGLERFKGIVPDHIVEPSLSDLMNTKDTVTFFAKHRIKMQP